MEWLWTWDGRCFGYRQRDGLWTHNGEHIGRFDGEEIYDKNGNYLGEIKGDRLITKTSKSANRKSGFIPNMSRIGIVTPVDRVGRVMYVGYEDFPELER